MFSPKRKKLSVEKKKLSCAVSMSFRGFGSGECLKREGKWFGSIRVYADSMSWAVVLGRFG